MPEDVRLNLKPRLVIRPAYGRVGPLVWILIGPGGYFIEVCRVRSYYGIQIPMDAVISMAAPLLVGFSWGCALTRAR